MNGRSLSFALMASGLFLAAPAFSQAPQNPPKKQQPQERAGQPYHRGPLQTADSGGRARQPDHCERLQARMIAGSNR